MNRDRIMKAAMAVCAAVLLYAAVISIIRMFGDSGIGGYANAEKYTSGDTVITETVQSIDVNWTSGRVIVEIQPGNTVELRENAGRTLSEDEKIQWWLDGDTLRIQFTKPGIRLNMPEKELIITLPEGTALRSTSIRTTSGDIEIQALKTEKLDLGSTSGDISAEAEAAEAVIGSTSGNAAIRLNGDTDSIRIGSTSGNIALEAEQAGSIEAESTSGEIGIAAANANEVKAGSTSGDIVVSLRKINTLKIEATSGSVTAKLPEEPGFTVKVTTTSGSFTYGIALTKDGNRYICGDGSAKADIGTTSGNVRIEPLQEE